MFQLKLSNADSRANSFRTILPAYRAGFANICFQFRASNFWSERTIVLEAVLRDGTIVSNSFLCVEYVQVVPCNLS